MSDNCRYCGVEVDALSDEALVRMAAFAPVLRKQGMVALRAHEVAVCRPCYVTYFRQEQGKQTDADFAEMRSVVSEVQAGRRVDASRARVGGFAHSLQGILTLYNRDGYAVEWDGPYVRVVPPKRRGVAEIPE